MKNKLISFLKTKSNFVLLSLLGLNFIIKILIFYNTTFFAVSEAGASYDFLKAIENGDKPALYYQNFRTILSYIGYIFKSFTGTLDAFYWFQALISTLSVYILYLICLKITENKLPALFAVLMATVLMDYHLLTPVFYNQIFEIFFTLIIIYLTLLLFEKKEKSKLVLVFFIPIIIYISLFFRGTLTYFWGILIIMSVVFIVNKDYELFRRLILAGIITMILFNILPQSNYRYEDINFQPVNDFVFFGHTLYGGDGGEGAFIYEKNRIRYEKKLKEFMIKNNYNSVTVEVNNRFQNAEIKEFISKTPHKWLLLQVRKVAYTFGIVPVMDSLKLLTTGKVPINWFISAFVIQAPYVLILLVFISLTVLFFKISDMKKYEILFIFLVLCYLIAATCLYGQYQERYRHVIIMAGIIPISAIYFNKFINSVSIKSIHHSRFTLLIIVLLILFSHWGYQAYNALVLNKARYFKALNLF